MSQPLCVTVFQVLIVLGCFLRNNLIIFKMWYQFLPGCWLQFKITHHIQNWYLLALQITFPLG
jgi:hypothetical protein